MADDKKLTEYRANLFEATEQFADFVATLTGLRAQLIGNGWSDEQAQDIVAYLFGWRPRDGSKPEGT